MSSSVSSKTISFGILRALAFLLGLFVLAWFLWSITAVLAYIGIAAVLSLIGRPIVMFLRDRLKFGNTFAVLLTLVFLLILILSAVSLLIPLAIEQSDNLKLLDNDEVSRNLEIFANQVSEFFGIQRVNIYDLVKETEYYQKFNLGFFSDLIIQLFSALGDFAIGLFSIMFITFFLLKDSRLLLEGILVFSKEGNEGRFLRAFTKIKQLLSRYFIGLVFQVLILFVLYTIILIITGTENAILIAFFCALLNLVPYLGPAVGYVLMSAFVITDNLGANFSEVIFPKLIIIAVGYGIVQTIDNFLNQPLIFGKSVKSHPLEIFIIILIAGIVFGVVGLVLAVPTYTAIKVIAQEFLSEYKIVKKLTRNL